MHYDNPGNNEMSKEDKKVYMDEENKYRAEKDVSTMIEYKKIMDDKDRYKMATHCAKKKSEEFESISNKKY